jgi:hypothetical protein
MPDARFLSQSVAEILGIYSPGAAPIIRGTELFPADVTMAHERGHRELCDSTSLGQYMVALALAASHASSEQQRSGARTALADAAEQCWLVHEGYATLRQLAYCRRGNRMQTAKQVEQSLPASYAAALACYPIDIQSLSASVSQAFGRLTDSQKQDLIGLGMEHAGYVIARAAKSIPIARALDESIALPRQAVSTAIRRQSPDGRLDRLRGKLTPAFVWRCLLSTLEGLRAMERSGTTRPLDERLDLLAREVSSDAGIPYEPSEAVALTSLLQKLGCGHLQVEARDGRDISNAEMRTYQTDSTAVGPSDMSNLKSIPLDAATDVYDNTFAPARFGLTPSVVCELGAKNAQGGGMVVMHAYATRDQCVAFMTRTGAKFLNTSIVRRAPANVAMQMLAFAVRLGAGDFASFPDKFRHTNWAWVVAEALVGDASNRWSWSVLKKRDVYVPFIQELGFQNRRVAETYAVPASPARDGPQQSGVAYTKGVPENIGLYVYEADRKLPGARAVRTTTLNQFSWPLAKAAPFDLTCVADTLLQGLYSQLMTDKLR